MRLNINKNNIKNDNFILLTIATDRNNWLDDWENTAKKWNYNYKILGLGEKWNGFETKINLIIDFSSKCDPNKLICIVDSYDLIIAGPQKELVDKFNKYNKKIVVGTEDVCGPNCFRTDIPVINNKRPNINGGFIIGKAKDINNLYKNVLQLCSYDDQVGIAKYAKANSNDFYLDSEQSMVLNLNYGKEIKDLELLNNGRFLYKPTNVKPIIIHTPFMQKDLGKRSNFVRSHCIDNYKKISKFKFIKEFLKHIRKHMKNPVYKKLTRIVISVLIVVTLILLYLLYKMFFK
jgi:preprotein translocase subunit SecE